MFDMAKLLIMFLSMYSVYIIRCIIGCFLVIILNYCIFWQWTPIWFSLIMHLYRPVMTRSVSFKIIEDMRHLFISLNAGIYSDIMVLHQRARNIMFIALCYDGIRSRYWYYIHSYYYYQYGQFPSKLPMEGTLWLPLQDMLCLFVSLS